MHRFRHLLIILTVAALSAASSPLALCQTAAKSILPGARPAIDASHYPSIQAALDAVPAEGGVVRLPAGDFKISQPLMLRRGDTRLEGVGGATNIINTNQEGLPALIVAHADGNKVKNEDRLWRVSLANFRITGNEKSGHGIVATLIEEIFLQGVSVSYHGGDGIRLETCYEDPRISDCLITYNKKVGLNILGGHDIVVSANQFEENYDALHCIDSFNLCMTGNNLDDHLNLGVLIENTYGSVLSGNMIEECAGTAITLDRDCYGTTIAANVIAHNGAGIDLKDAHGCAVSANTFTIMQKDALRIGPSSGRITVTGNNFSNSFLGDGKVKRNANDQNAGGLVLESTRDVVVTGNLFSGLRPKAVELRGGKSEGVVFETNVIVDAESDLDPRAVKTQPK